MRYGTRTHCKKRWTRKGRRPVCKVKIGYQWNYLYVALCPYSGDVFACILSRLNQECFDIFMGAFKEHLTHKNIPPEKVLLIGDGATAHQQDIVAKQAIHWQKIPTACPELNPVERFFQELRKYTACEVFDNLTQIDIFIENLVNEYIYNPLAVTKLTLFTYLDI